MDHAKEAERLIERANEPDAEDRALLLAEARLHALLDISAALWRALQ